MGVDIMGSNPKLTSKSPVEPGNDASREEWENYYESRDEWLDENPGYYFRSNWWGWRPILVMCDEANQRYDLNIDMTGWGENSGFGLKTQEECTKLAEALEYMMGEPDSIVKQEDADNERIYLCLGCWCNKDGQFVDAEEDQLNQTYPPGTILHAPVVSMHGTISYPAHSCSKAFLKEWINFLKNCGGFEIW